MRLPAGLGKLSSNYLISWFYFFTISAWRFSGKIKIKCGLNYIFTIHTQRQLWLKEI